MGKAIAGAALLFAAMLGAIPAYADDGRHRPVDVYGGRVELGPAYQPFPYYAPPHTRVFIGRSAFWADGCRYRSVIEWRQGRKLIIQRLFCD